jgi:hypothetical protein
MIVFCAAGAVAASAAETSISRTVTGAFNTVVIQATNAATAATKAADDAIQSSKKKKTKDTKASKSKDADTKDAEEPASSNVNGKPGSDDKATSKGDAKSDGKLSRDGKDKSADGKPGDTPAGKGAPADAAKAADGKAPNGKPGDPKAAPAKPVELTEWPAADIEIAKARCTALLKTVDAVTMPEAPFRSGDCGTPAPVRLISLGKNPEVSLSPPALVTCDMVVALAKWIKEDVQPLSRKHLGGNVIKIETMSDYSCRKAYGRVGNKLSEHGKANALDIRGFTTNKGQEAVVLSGWGQTRRDLERQIAAAKAAADKADALKAMAEQAEKAKIEAASNRSGNNAVEKSGRAGDTASADANIPRATIIDGVPGAGALKDAGFGLAPTRLGGPKDEKSKDKISKKSKAADKKAIAKAADDVDAGVPAGPGVVVQPIPGTEGNPTMAFLHDTHDAACRIFGTTLGPEANDAHRNHFHVDMAERKVKKICD